MPKVVVRQCPITGKLFPLESKKAYIKHLKKARKNLHLDIKTKRVVRESESRSQEIREQVQTLEELIGALYDHLPDFCLLARSKRTNFYDHYSKVQENITDIVIERFVFKDRIACTHSAPLGEEENFCQTPDKPTHFPGFEATFTVRYDPGCSSAISAALEAIGIHTGSGGGNGKMMRWGITLWAADWPALVEEIEKKKIIDRLTGK